MTTEHARARPARQAGAPVGRRSLLLGAAAALACSRAEPAAGGNRGPVPSSPNCRILEWDLGAQPWGRARVVVVVPTWGGTDARFPVLVALHGRGEALRGPVEGALGWPRDYAMVRAMDRLRAPPLVEADYEGLVEPPRLAATNAALAARPFGGLIVACPYLPDVHPATTGDIGAYTRFVLGALIPRVRAQTPALSAPESTGIDGVSLGGAVALRIGLASPESFGAVGAIQPALSEGQDPDWTALAQAARARRPGLKLRLLTSHDDPFREAIAGVDRAWADAGLAHDFADVVGPHDYVFNRGPGSIELLLWHDRALARAAI
jgi:enterochelin esterase-like enzyme